LLAQTAVQCRQLSQAVSVLKPHSYNPQSRPHTMAAACPAVTRKDFLGTRHSPLTQNFYFICKTVVSLLWRIRVYTNILDRTEALYELPLLPNNTVSDILLHKSGVVLRVDWIFVKEAPVWRWLREYMTLGKTFYNLLFQQEFLVALFTSKFSSLQMVPNFPSWHYMLLM
jgi:hypothetical protein